MSFRFLDRSEAGRLLGDLLRAQATHPDAVILGLPRGGVVVAFEVARRWQRPLHAFLVRKLGVPGHEELAMGALADNGDYFLNEEVLKSLRISPDIIDNAVARERRELARQEQLFQTGPAPDLKAKLVILIDDGLATGATMRAAVLAVRPRQPARIVVAVPVAAPDIAREFEREVDEVVCVQSPPNLGGVGEWYEDFSQTTDGEVQELLARAAGLRPVAPDKTRISEGL